MKSIIDNIDLQQLGEELKKAREKRGLRQEDAARVIDVARTTLTAIEKGERRIKEGELIALAEAYGRPVSDFVRRSRPQTQAFEPQFRAAYKRIQANIIHNECIDEFEELCRNYAELEQITGTALRLNYPDEKHYDLPDIKIERIAESLAIEERNRLGLGDSPLPILRNILEQEVGLRIFYIPLKPSNDYSAMYVYDKLLGGCIAINILHPEERRRWSLAHEYAHFLAHRYQADLTFNHYQRLPAKEQFADAFARYFLMPTSSLVRQASKELTPADLCILANYYGVSVQAITLRLEEIKALPAGVWDRLRRSGFRIKEAQQELGLESIPAHSEKWSQRYLFLAVQAFEKELISEGQFTRFLGVTRVDARRIAERWQIGNEDDSQSELDIFTVPEDIPGV